MRAVNLIPADQRSGASVGLGRSQGSAYAVLVVVGVLALFGFLYGHARHEISSNRTQVATLDAQAQQAQSEASQLVGYEALNASREKRLKAVEGLIDSRFDWAHVMSEFARVLPAHASIDSLTGTVGSTTGAAVASAPSSTSAAGGSSAVVAPVTSATPPGSIPSLTVGGCASSQDEVARTLQRLRLLDGVKEVTLQSSASTSSSGSSAAASAGCGNEGTSFTVAVVFTPLPAASAYPTAKTVADPAIPTDPKPSGRTK